MDCPFCTIDKAKTRIIKQGKHVLVILSNPRLVEGHLLVVPKRHVEKLSQLKEEEQKELFDTTIEFQEKLLQKLCTGCDIRQNYRPFQKQDRFKVDHLHIHIQPREYKDELYQKSQVFEKDIFQDLTEEERQKMTKMLKNNQNV